jgi:hypothetical protein
MFNRISAGLDGSENAERCLPWAEQMDSKQAGFDPESGVTLEFRHADPQAVSPCA